MSLIQILASLSLVGAAIAECEIHEEDHFYYNVSDLGLAALDNRVDDVDGLLAGGCELNYNGTAVVLEYSYDENDYEYGDYEYDYGEYGDADIVVGGMTALHIAATEGNHDMVAKLLSIPGIEIDKATNHGATPLFDAASSGFVESMVMLISAGADLNHQDEWGWTPLFQTCAYGYVHSAKLLIESGAGMDIIGTLEGETALILAVAFGYPDVAEILVESGADIFIQDIYNMTALDWALYTEDTVTEKMLRLAAERGEMREEEKGAEGMEGEQNGEERGEEYWENWRNGK